MIDRLVPGGVVVVETTADLVAASLFPEEQRSVARAVEKRRREFVTGRACARLALAQLGIAAAAIPSGPRGEPVWPSGVVGSITHCRGYRGCAVAVARKIMAIGIDAEINEPLPTGVWEQVARGPELEWDRHHDGVWLDRLAFSAKEAVYKAWFPMTGGRLEFEDIELTLDLRACTFDARLRVRPPIKRGAVTLQGRWCAGDGLLATAVALPGVSGVSAASSGQRSDS